MLWFFKRSGQRLQCEIRPAADGCGVELMWTQEGDTRLERFTDVDDATARRRQLDAQLKHDGWVRIGRETPPDAKRFL
jgi:hypothetical protein